MTMSRRLGFLWEQKVPDGNLYFSGFLEGMGGDIPIKIVKNLRRTNENHAPYIILRKNSQGNHVDLFEHEKIEAPSTTVE